jgi:hypothetical protein
MVNSLKKQINDFKQIVKAKDEEINSLKVNSKVVNYINLENDYKNKNEENFILKDNLNKIKEAFCE